MRIAARSALVLATGWLLAIATSAHAWTLRVDDAGGPADLETAATAAEQRWRDAGADVDGVARTVLVRYETEERMGPDAIMLVVTGGGPGVDLEIWMRAEDVPASERDDALTIAIGIALGGTPGSGLLDPRLTDEPRVPGVDDVAALALGRDVAGDVTGDGRVGFDDLVALAEAWGRRGVNLPADLDGDGVVDEDDLRVLREHYRFAPLPSERTAPAADPDVDDGGAAPAAPSDESPDEGAPADDAVPADEVDVPSVDEVPTDDGLTDEQPVD